MTRPFSDYDTRHYPTVDVVQGYQEWSLIYDQDMGDEFDIALLLRLKTIYWNELQRVVDLACGTGRIGAWMKSQGVTQIAGVDISEAMLRFAHKKQIYTELFTADITSTPCTSGSYRLGISSLAACHIKNLLSLYQEAARIIEPDGLFILADYHPFFLLRGIPTNFKPSTGEPVAIENYVHLISDHVQVADQSGWVLTEMHERIVDDAWVEKQPGFSKFLYQPISFVMVWQRLKHYES